MRPFKTLTAFVVLAVLFAAAELRPACSQDKSADVADAPEWSAESRELFGYFEAAYANASAIRKGDCLFRIHETFDSVGYNPDKLNLDGVLDDIEVLVRLRFDHDLQKVAVATMRIVDRTDLTLQDPATGAQGRRETTRSTVAFCIDSDTAGQYSFMNGSYTGKSPLVNGSPKDAMRALGLPDIRGLGWTGGLESNNYELFHAWLRAAESGRHFFEVRSRSGKFVDIRKYCAADPKKENYNYYTDFRVDTESLTISRSKSFRKDHETGIVYNISFPNEIVWKEMSGVQMPVSLKKSGPDYRAGGSNTKQWGRLEHQMDIYWFSVNEPIAPSAFDGTEIRRPESVSDLLDPVKNNATTIIELMRREKPVESKTGG